jgi:hypothetical protein
MHVIWGLRGIRVLGGDDVQDEDWALSVFEWKVLKTVVDQWMVQ